MPTVEHSDVQPRLANELNRAHESPELLRKFILGNLFQRDFQEESGTVSLCQIALVIDRTEHSAGWLRMAVFTASI